MTESGKIALWIAGGLAGILLLGKKAQEGIGATKKRRIYKEISLAQQAGVDFSKKYEELTDDEIEALRRVSNDTGFTETYYKGLKKAYDAISGIGEAYDVADENGNTVLTWIEDPEIPSAAYDDPERYKALLEARAIDEDRQYADTHRAQALEEREKELAARRKRLSRDGRSSQMALFGCGATEVCTDRLWKRYLDTNNVTEIVMYLDDEDGKGHSLVGTSDQSGGRTFYAPSSLLREIWRYCAWHGIPALAYNNGYMEANRWYKDDDISGVGALRMEELLEPELMDYLRTYLDSDEVSSAMYYIDKRREPLYVVNPDLSDQIHDMVDDWCITNAIDPDSVWSLVDEEDILFAL